MGLKRGTSKKIPNKNRTTSQKKHKKKHKSSAEKTVNIAKSKMQKPRKKKTHFSFPPWHMPVDGEDPGPELFVGPGRDPHPPTPRFQTLKNKYVPRGWEMGVWGGWPTPSGGEEGPPTPCIHSSPGLVPGQGSQPTHPAWGRTGAGRA